VSIEAAVVAKLLADGDIAALIVDRLFPEYDRQNNKDYPLAVYKVQNQTNLTANDGPTGLRNCDIVIAAIAETHEAATEIADALEAVLDSQKGVWSGITVQGSFLKEDGISDDVITEPQTEEILYFVRECSFNIWYTTD
jgi:hypothetical protein